MPDLRQEMLNMVQSANGQTDECEKRIMVHIKQLGERCNDLQSQIKEIERERDEVRGKYVEKAKESLLTS